MEHLPVAPGAAQPDDELAAALAAVEALLQAEQAQADADEPPAGTGWHNSAKLAVQGLRPTRSGVAPRWATVERIRRGSSGSGIVGL